MSVLLIKRCIICVYIIANSTFSILFYPAEPYYRYCHLYLKLVKPRHFSLECLCQARKVSGQVFVLGESILPLSTIFLLDFGNVPTELYLLFFILLVQNYKNVNLSWTE